MNGTGKDRRNSANSVPRYRLTDADGKEYAPFRLKPGVPLHKVMQEAGPDLEVQILRT